MQDISRQFGVAIRWLPLIIVLALVAGVLAYAWSSSRPVVVEATGTLRVEPGREASIQDRTESVLAAVEYASEMESPGFAQTIVRRLGLDETRDELLRRLSVDVDPEAEVALIQLGVRSTDPQKAQRIAKSFGDELIRRKSSSLFTADMRDATQQVEKLESDLDALRRRLRNLRAKSPKDAEDFDEISRLPGEIATLQAAIIDFRPFTNAYVRNLPRWFAEPRVPTESVAAGPLYWTLLALLVGGMAGAGLAFAIEYLRRLGKVHDDRDLELATAQATLGSAFESSRAAKRGDADRLVMLHYPRSDEAEAFRSLIARIGFTGGSARTLMVASASPTDATSLIAANLAVAYAEAGRNVILVDADYRSPRIHGYFGARNDRGLTTILSDANVPLGWATVPSPHPRLGLMPSGPALRENAEPLGSRQLNALLRRLLQAADLVIFASPAVRSSLDAAVLAEGLDAALLVVPRDSSEDETVEAAEALQAADGEFVGAVLYRKVRRTRRGAKTKVAPAPDGWGPTWPTMYEQPARIPAIAGSARLEPHAPAAQVRPADAGATRPAQREMSPAPPPAAVSSTSAPPTGGAQVRPPSAQGPYATSFRPQPVVPGAPGGTPPTPTPEQPSPSPVDTTAGTAATEAEPGARESIGATGGSPPDGAAPVAIPVQPESGDADGSGSRPPGRPAASPSSNAGPTSPESVPG